MGSGPACYLAHERPCAALVLFAPFHSIKTVAKEHIGCLSCCAPNIFKNYEYIAKIAVPTVIIHGHRDNVINHSNSASLYKASGATQIDKTFVNPVAMSHNDFLMDSHLVQSVNTFLTNRKVIHNKAYKPIRFENILRYDDTKDNMPD